MIGFKLTSSGISPINAEVQGICYKLRPTNLKELRSFEAAVNQYNRFVPDLATICSSLDQFPKETQSRTEMKSMKWLLKK